MMTMIKLLRLIMILWSNVMMTMMMMIKLLLFIIIMK